MWRFGDTVADPDLWGHVRFGIDKIQAGQYLSNDVYSYLTEGRIWFNHEWLGEVVMGAVYLTLGAAGLSVLKALLAGAVVAFLTWWLFRSRIAPVRVAILMTVGVLLLTPTFGTFRPQIFTTLLFTATLAVIAAHGGEGKRLIWLLPAMFAVWVNLHGGVLSGIAVVWVWATICVALRRERAWQALGVAGVSSAALLLNPHGAAHIRFLLETATVRRPEIVEWASLDLLTATGIGYLVFVFLLAAALYESRHELDLALVVPLIGVMIGPLIAWRHLQLFVPAAVILGGPYLATLLAMSEEPADPARRMSPFVASSLILVAIAAGAFTLSRVARASNCVVIESSQFESPSRAVYALDQARVTGNAVVTFNWGEYIIWHLGPDLQVSIDGRRETVYSEEVLRANLDFANGADDWRRLLHMASADFVIQATGSPGAVLMASEPGWHRAYEDPTATVFVPSSSPLELRGDDAIPDDGDGLCFGADNSQRTA